MKTKFFALAFALLVGVFAFAQSVNPVSGHVSSDTAGSVAAIIKYIGTGSAATVEIDASSGDIELEIADVADNTNVDTGSVCAGGTANSLDVSDAQCDTFGEVADLVNASTHWRMVLVGALRSDSTNNTIFTLAESQATLKAGLPLYFDSTVSTHTTVALVPPRCVTDISCYMTPTGKLLENPFGGKQIDLRWVEGYATYGTAASFAIYSVRVSQKASGSENVMTLHTEPAGATGTNKQLSQFQYQGLYGRPNDKVLVRLTATGTNSAYNLHAYGNERSVN